MLKLSISIILPHSNPCTSGFTCFPGSLSTVRAFPFTEFPLSTIFNRRSPLSESMSFIPDITWCWYPSLYLWPDHVSSLLQKRRIPGHDVFLSPGDRSGCLLLTKGYFDFLADEIATLFNQIIIAPINSGQEHL